MQQLHGHEHHAPDRNRSHMGADGVKLIQEGAMDSLISQKNDSRSRDIGVRCLPENPWTRRFKPRSSGANRRGDGVGASVDDGESGTDTVQERIPTHVRDLKSCVGENLVDKSSGCYTIYLVCRLLPSLYLCSACQKFRIVMRCSLLVRYEFRILD
jgi:hypothetical protein